MRQKAIFEGGKKRPKLGTRLKKISERRRLAKDFIREKFRKKRWKHETKNKKLKKANRNTKYLLWRLKDSVVRRRGRKKEVERKREEKKKVMKKDFRINFSPRRKLIEFHSEFYFFQSRHWIWLRIFTACNGPKGDIIFFSRIFHVRF